MVQVRALWEITGGCAGCEAGEWEGSVTVLQWIGLGVVAFCLLVLIYLTWAESIDPFD